MSKEEAIVVTNSQVEKVKLKTWEFDEFQDEDFADMFKSHNVPPDLQEKILALRNILSRNVIVDAKQEIMNGSRDSKQLIHNLSNSISKVQHSLLSQHPPLSEKDEIELNEKERYLTCLKVCVEEHGRELAMNLVAVINRRNEEVYAVVDQKYQKLIGGEPSKAISWDGLNKKDVTETIRRYPEIVNDYLSIIMETGCLKEVIQLINTRPRFARELSTFLTSDTVDKSSKQNLLKTYSSIRDALPEVSRKPPRAVSLRTDDSLFARVLDTADSEEILQNLEDNREFAMRLKKFIPAGETKITVSNALEDHAKLTIEHEASGGIMISFVQPDSIIRMPDGSSKIVMSDDKLDEPIHFKNYHLTITGRGFISEYDDGPYSFGFLFLEKGKFDELELVDSIIRILEEGESLDPGEKCGFNNYALNQRH